MDQTQSLREHLLELLDGRSAHIDIKTALDGFPIDAINERPSHCPHSAWQLLEHIRIAQRDILDFCQNANYEEMKWPDDYWPSDEGNERSWADSVDQIFADLESMREIVRDQDADLYAKIEHGSGQTKLREVLLVADHNAYHLGQLMLLRRMIEASRHQNK